MSKHVRDSDEIKLILRTCVVTRCTLITMHNGAQLSIKIYSRPLCYPDRSKTAVNLRMQFRTGHGNRAQNLMGWPGQ
jgi:hypothetical protein